MRRTHAFSSVLLGLSLFAGCSTLTPPNVIGTFTGEARPKTPSRLVCFWHPYAQTNPNGGAPLRGVGGRIVFFGGRGMGKSVKVDGDLVVYVFDASDPMPERGVPLRTAVYKKDSLPLHYRQDESDLHGYEFFVPLDELDAEEMDVAVIAVFTEHKRNGHTSSPLPSDQVVMTLPGSERRDTPRDELRADDPPEHRSLPRSRSSEGNSGVRHAYERNSKRDARRTDSVSFADHRDVSQSRPGYVAYANDEHVPETAPRDAEELQVETIDLPVHYARAYLEDLRRKQSAENAAGNDEAGETPSRKTFRDDPVGPPSGRNGNDVGSQHLRTQEDYRRYYESAYADYRDRNGMGPEPTTDWPRVWPETPKQFESESAARPRMSPNKYVRNDRSGFVNGNFRIQNDWNAPSPRNISNVPRLERPGIAGGNMSGDSRSPAHAEYDDLYDTPANPSGEASAVSQPGSEQFLRDYQLRQSRSRENGVRVMYGN